MLLDCETGMKPLRDWEDLDTDDEEDGEEEEAKDDRGALLLADEVSDCEILVGWGKVA